MGLKDKIILGIDPGTTIMGFGLIRVNNQIMELIQLHELQLKKYNDHYLKLEKIFNSTQDIIDQFHPDQIAIEAPFFGKNVQSMLKLGRAQGLLWLLDCQDKFQLLSIPQKKSKCPSPVMEMPQRNRLLKCYKAYL